MSISFQHLRALTTAASDTGILRRAPNGSARHVRTIRQSPPEVVWRGWPGRADVLSACGGALSALLCLAGQDEAESHGAAGLRLPPQPAAQQQRQPAGSLWNPRITCLAVHRRRCTWYPSKACMKAPPAASAQALSLLSGAIHGLAGSLTYV